MMAADPNRGRRAKNIAVALALFGFALLWYLLTLVRLGGNVS